MDSFWEAYFPPPKSDTIEMKMRPVRICIDKTPENCLNRKEIKYTFETLFNLVGLPCHFVRDSGEGEIDVHYGKVPSRGSRLFIEMLDLDRGKIQRPMKMIKEENRIFLLFSSRQREEGIVERAETRISVRNDLIFSSYFLLTGWEERFLRLDRWDRHAVRDSFLYKEKLLHLPVINQYASFLRSIFEVSHHPVPIWPSNRRYAVCLTHDVDYPEMIPWIEGLRYLAMYKMKSELSKASDILAGRESFWKFREWMEWEKDCGMRSAIYFCGMQGGLLRYFLRAPDPFYDIKTQRFKEVLDDLSKNGFEVGLHSSFLAYRSLDRFREEKACVEEALKKTIYGNRHHYMHLNPRNPSETILMQHQIGFLYDSSICFLKRSGFRRGVCSPFHLYDSKSHQAVPTVELPTTLMDDHLFGRMKYSYFDHYRSEIDALLDSVKEYGGIFVADYHIRVLNPTFFPGWKESYAYLLKKIQETDDYYCDTPLNIARYWKTREDQISDGSIDEGRHIDE